MNPDYAGCGWCGKVLALAHAPFVWHGIPFCNRPHETNWQKREDARVQARREIHDRMRNVSLASPEDTDGAA